jgi:hypothetical protein
MAWCLIKLREKFTFYLTRYINSTVETASFNNLRTDQFSSARRTGFYDVYSVSPVKLGSQNTRGTFPCVFHPPPLLSAHDTLQGYCT